MDALYVATDREGIDRANDAEVMWALPTISDGTFQPGAPTTSKGAPLILRNSVGLLGALDEAIFVAESLDATENDASKGASYTKSARLLSKTNWDGESAARFALDCAEHVIEDLADVKLPDGTSLGEVIAQARGVIESLEPSDTHNLGLFARLSAVRRLRRRGGELGDFARELLVEDVQSDINALDDPAYAALAALVDAVLGAVEAIRSIALPRYVRAREDPVDEHSDNGPSSIPRIVSTPWGPIAIGAEHRSAYEPSWAAARDATSRARDAIADRKGEKAAIDERAWQAERLVRYLHESQIQRDSSIAQ